MFMRYSFHVQYIWLIIFIHSWGEKGTSGRQFVNVYKKNLRASLVAQWLRVCLPMQEIRVRALVWEDPTCRGAAGPVSHDY